MEFLDYIMAILIVVILIKTFKKKDTVCKNELCFVDIIEAYHLGIVTTDNIVCPNDITKIKNIIAMDIFLDRVKPMASISDNTPKKLETFITKGNVGFYIYFRGVTIPKYYVRKVKDRTKIITFKDGEQIKATFDIPYDVFLKDIITILNTYKEI